MRRATLYLTLIAVAMSWLRGADAAVVTITSNEVHTAQIYDNGGQGHYDFDDYYGTTIPTTDFLLESSNLSADQYAKTTLNYSAAGGQTVLDAQFSFSRQGGQYDSSRTYGVMSFTVDADTTYKITGNIAVDDIAADGSSVVHFGTYLVDTTSGYLEDTYHQSRNTTDESFVLGVAGGDWYYYMRPGSSLTGSLVAGHQYLWRYEAFNQAYPDADSGATATGAFNLTIGEAAAVPEPATLTIWGLGALGALLLRRRARSA